MDDPVPAFESIARKINLNIEKLNFCLEDNKVDVLINEDKEYGRSLGVRSIPTYFVNGKMIVGNKSLKLELSHLTKTRLE